MADKLNPKHASELALGVYSINSGDEDELRVFLANRIFSQSRNNQKQLQADVGGRILRSANDAFGLCAKGAGEYAGDLFLIFRGTTEVNNKADFVTDARIGVERSKTGLPVHIGFNHAFKSMLTDIRSFIGSASITGKVHCIGHSLGGAVATLAADWMASETSLPVRLYTFGQPRAGLTFFSLMLTKKINKKNIYRVFHTTDPVPMVPVFPYTHSPLPGNGRRIETNNPIHSGEAHSMALYDKHMMRKKWADFSLLPSMYTHEHAIKSWLESRVDSNPMCPTTFEWLERAMIWLLSKQLAALSVGIQWGVMGVHTFVDKVAWILAKGIELGDKVAGYVNLFVRKVIRILGIQVREGLETLTHAFLRYLLQALIKRANDMAVQAIRGLTSRR